MPTSGATAVYGAALAEERALELRVRAIERVVVPVEPAARLGGGDEQAEEHRAEQRLVLRGAGPGVGAREDRSSRLALQLLDRDQRVGPSSQAGRPFLDERTHEWAVLVQRRATRMLMLDEGDGQLGSVIELAEQKRERAEREAAKSKLELGSANGHLLRIRGVSPESCRAAERLGVKWSASGAVCWSRSPRSAFDDPQRAGPHPGVLEFHIKPLLVLAALAGVVKELLDLGAVALDLLRAVEHLLDIGAITRREPRQGEVV